MVVWGKLQIPETVESAEGAWDELEIIVETVRPYIPLAGNPQMQAANQSQASQPAARVAAQNIKSAEPTAFNPLPINWEIDLAKADMGQLSTLAKTLG